MKRTMLQPGIKEEEHQRQGSHGNCCAPQPPSPGGMAWWVHVTNPASSKTIHTPVIPAQEGIQCKHSMGVAGFWIPACAGMTEIGVAVAMLHCSPSTLG